MRKPNRRTVRFFVVSVGAVVIAWAAALLLSAILLTSTGKPTDSPRISVLREGAHHPTCFNAGTHNYAPHVDETIIVDADFACPSSATPVVDLGGGSVVKAELTGPQGVRIDPMYDAQQPLLLGHKNVWAWRVTATKSGEVDLMAVVTAYDATGKILQAENKPIPVHIFAEETAGQWISRLWHNFVTLVSEVDGVSTGLSAIFGLLLGRNVEKVMPKRAVEEPAVAT